MQISQQKVEELVSLVQRKYPNWNSFSDPRFIKDEVEYKQQAIAKARAALNADELQDLLQQGQFDDFLRRFDKVGKSTNLLFLGVPKAGDLGILYVETLEKPTFCRAVFDLVYGDGDSPARLARYLGYVQTHNLPDKWTFPTYFLFLCHPETDFFIKPQTVRWFLQFIESSVPLSQPSAETYAAILQVVAQVKQSLNNFNPHDFVDIQGLVWAAYVAARRQKQLAQPFNQLFGSWEEAEWAFELLAEIANMLGISTPDDPRAAFKIRYRSASYHLRLSYGAWMVLDFAGLDGKLQQLAIALQDNQLSPMPLRKDDFAQREGEHAVNIWYFDPNEFKENQERLRPVYQATMEQIGERFKTWKGSPYNFRSTLTVARAVFDLDERMRLLSEGVEAEPEVEDAGPDAEGEVRYWKIAPGENAWQWDECREQGFIGIGWDDFGDLTNFTRIEFDLKRDQLLNDHSDWTPEAVEQVWKFTQIKEGDRIVANRGTSEVLGIGTVVGPYYFQAGERYPHRLTVQWDDISPKSVNMGGWRKTLIELKRDTFENIVTQERSDFFSARTFELLKELHDTPTRQFYLEHKAEFKTMVEEPFQRLLRAVAQKLPPSILELMETESKLYSRFLKNDYGQGGAWDFYWGAFYPKGGKRTEDAQLSLWLNFERLEIGFYIGNTSEISRERFGRNVIKHRATLQGILAQIHQDPSIRYGPNDNFIVEADGTVVAKRELTFDQWLDDPAQGDYDASVILPSAQVLEYTPGDLIELVTDKFIKLFPLVRLATLDEPIPDKGTDLSGKVPPASEISNQALYSLQQFVDDTSFSATEIESWVRALERKQQVIFYGPPGTGKTFVAQHLAAHWIGGGNGFKDLVQFHPAYAYEDFMQGLRPRQHPNGGLDYPMVAGRFLEFCEKARARSGRCVLIVDEINRANLARVFGELMYLLEYRDQEIPLAGGTAFRIPGNVYLIGTMNTADRSIALVDHALRRRFAFLGLYPNMNVLQQYHSKQQPAFPVEKLVYVLDRINQQINDPHYAVGVSFFMRPDLEKHIGDIWQTEIEPYLEEYFFDQRQKVEPFRWTHVGKELSQ